MKLHKKLAILFLVLGLSQLLFAQKITISGKTISGNERWTGIVLIEGDVVVAPGARLEIAPGTRVVFSANKDLSNGGRDKRRSELIIKGSLLAKGAINNKIWFTSAAQGPRMQDWYGIRIMNPRHTAIIEYAVVEYAYNGITIKKSDPVISNVQLQYNYNAGLIIEVAAKPKILGNIISENGYAGVICNTGAAPILTDNMITKNDIGLISFGTARPNLGNLARGKDYNEGRNGLFDNLTYDVHNHSVRDIMAENSSWGTNDVKVVAEHIYDKTDDAKYGKVDISPALGGVLNLESKVLLSQSTEVQRNNPPAVATNTSPRQSPANNSTRSQSTVQETSSVKKDQPKQTLSTLPEPKPVMVNTDSLRLAVKTIAPKKEEIKEEPKIDYNQVFLDAFLDKGRMILKTVRPVIYDRDRQSKMKGKVIVRVVVDRLGNVEEASILRGLNDYYDEQALAAARQFKFKPGTLNGNPVKFSTSLIFKF